MISPWIINLELTNACNLECIFCSHHVLKKEMVMKEMDDGLLQKIMSDVKVNLWSGKKIHELGLVGLGEPTLNSRLERHLDLITPYADIFDRVSVNSNLVSMGEREAALLLRSKVNSYTFSVNASNRETYREMSGRDKFSDVLKNLKGFFALMKKMGKAPRIDIQVMDSKMSSIEELKALLPEAGAFGVNFFVRKVYTKPVVGKGSALLNLELPTQAERYPCWSIYSRIYVDVEGNLYPCTIANDCYRESSGMFLGNVRHDTISSLFNNERICSARKRAETGGLPFPECKGCNLWLIMPNNFRPGRAQNRWIKNKKQIRGFVKET